MKRVLLLNASYEVHDVITWKEAVMQMVNGKAKKPSGHDEYHDIKLVGGAVFKLPTVLILITYVRVPFKSISISKENVLRRDSFECQYCGTRLTSKSGTIDHVFPTSRGGKHKWGNVVAACRKCNCAKDNRTPEEAGMKLRCRPFIPQRDVMIITAIDLRTHKTWQRWIMT